MYRLLMPASGMLQSFALLLCIWACASDECAASLRMEDIQHALLDDAASDDAGIQLIQAKAQKVNKDDARADSEAKDKADVKADFDEMKHLDAHLDQQGFKPSVEDWTKVQTGLMLLRGHAEASSGHKEASEADSMRLMLSTLKDLFDDANQSIQDLDEKELESKEWIASQENKHEHRVEEIEAREEKHILSHDFYINETRTETMMIDYWEGVRRRQHQKYISLVKVKKDMLERLRGMIDTYENVLTDKPAENVVTDSDSAPPVRAQLPDHYQPKAIIDFCDAALEHVNNVLEEL